MATARDLIAGSLRLIGVISSGESLTSDEQADGLSALNDMLDSWSTESLIIASRVKETFPLISTQQVYTMGASGNFNTVRPMKIEKALLQMSTGVTQSELPIKIVNLDQWALITVKNTQSAIPTRLYIEDTYPLISLNFWPIPNVVNNVVLYSWKQLTAFSTVDTVLSFHPGYARALRYNLALELAPEYGKQIDPNVINTAMESKENIKRKNIKPFYLEADPALTNHSAPFNWLTGE